MKKVLALVLALVMVLSLAACGAKEETAVEETVVEEPVVEESPAMTYEEFMAAEIGASVVVDCYVQDHQSWWDNKITVYAADENGAYFLYELTCPEDQAQLFDTEGFGIRVTGSKETWQGEIEIQNATFEPLSQTYVSEITDVTALVGTDDLINHQNERVVFTDAVIEAYDETGAAFAYKDAEGKTDDLYFKATVNGETVNFCVEYYLRGSDTEVYKAVEALQVGDVVDVQGYLYWYEGANPHVTAIVK